MNATINMTNEGVDLVQKARAFAAHKHRGQIYGKGRNYFTAHIEKVVDALRIVTTDEAILCAGYLHDTIEDCGVTREEIATEFNEEIADLVEEVTKVPSKTGGYCFPNLKTQKGIMIKFADRLCNVSSMEDWSEKRKYNYLNSSRFWKLK